MKPRPWLALLTYRVVELGKIMTELVYLIVLLVTAAALSPNGTRPAHLSPEDYAFLKTLPKTRAASILPGFKYFYVDSSGQWSYNLDPNKRQIQVAGSPGTSWDAVFAAAEVVVRMTWYMPRDIFDNLASRASVGVFSAAEKLVVYPEYAHLANGFCGTSCSGSCSQTCTFDGRKYEDIAGVGGQRAVVLDDNVLCTARDPYRGQENILAHEFTHTIHEYGLSGTDKSRVTASFNVAKQHGTWALSAYAMQNEQEYLAEGATVFFGVNTNGRQSNGGMNECSVGHYCLGEVDGREHLRLADPGLYGVLYHVFTDNRPNLLSGLTICPASHAAVG